MRLCDIEGCGRPHKGRGWCDFHYNRWKRLGDPLAERPARELAGDKPCSVKGCDATTRRGAMCNAHYLRWLRHGDPTAGGTPRRKRGEPPRICSVDGCAKKAAARGWCPMHYRRWKTHGDLDADFSIRRGPCSVDGCDRLALSKGMCQKHLRRWQKHGDPTVARVDRPATAQWRHNGQGYVQKLWRDHPNANANGIVLQHHAVMAEHLGRPIRKGETVHHVNGQRDDNRLENLELWSRAHPPGQRVRDLVSFAEEILALYGGEAQRALF